MRNFSKLSVTALAALLVVLAVIAAGLLSGPAGFRSEPRSAEAALLSEVKKVLASDALFEDSFGFSVAVSGDTAIVGAPFEDAGGSYAGLLNITDRARLDDGRLDLCLLPKGGLLRLGWLLPWVLLRRHHSRAGVIYRQLESLDVRTPGLSVQVDGEYLGETPLRFGVAPAALRVVVPRGLRSELFRR